MATVILTAVGSVVGGPIGGAIGAILGQTIDRGVLFKPKGRQGPRLTELAVQTSSYGTPIPQLFGTMRVAGTVIWSTDLIETKAKSSGGKGQPSVTNFSYAASFAVLLSARPIIEIGRIWADGKLLRGAGGDLKTSTGFRVHLGGEGQAPDPLIVAAEGADLAPAHRGCAYAVFEMLQLADYGNRIPSLTFEVIADPGPVAIGAMAEALGDGLIDGSAVAMPLSGFAAYGDGTRGVLETLAAAGGAWFSPSGAMLTMRDAEGPAHPIEDVGAAAQGARGERRRRAVAPIGTVPQTITVAHYDPARDYQTGVQRARRPGAGNRSDRIDLPAAIDAAAAKTMADRTLARAESGRERREIALDWRGLRIVPGATVTIAGVAGRWRVARWTLEAMVVALDLVRLDDHAPASSPASSGRVLASADSVHGPTIMHVFELPVLGDRPLDTARLLVAAAGASPGWRRAALLTSMDGGVGWTAAGSTAAPATIGALVTPVPERPSTLRDLATIIEVELAHGGMALASADDSALDSGANLALLGDELIQFGQAEQIGVTRWRLSRLLRGRRGSEAAAGKQAIGDRFVLIEDDSLTTIELPLAMLGSGVGVMASGIGDVAGPVRVDVVPSGASVRPPSPAHVRVRENGADLSIDWVRRSRAGWRWIDGVDAPLGEESEAYSVDVHPPGGSGPLRIETTQPTLTIAGDAAPSGTMIAVRQRGASGESPPAILLLP
ncbi:phage tail protein [Sphingomonas sp. 28-62-11]|uniref:phage tail protein n=1 Tax=Sphingomonas sp. 28-62-11 TaxID=1970432 RepID=UPI000BD149E4|nr:MAG: hypothetical protein B7Y49_14335 [Sphingomonas sp. 28-62-11]